MRSITGRKGWFGHSIAVAATMLVAGLQFLVSPAWAGYELPPGERITNLPHIPRSMPQKEAYEIYDPVIGRNFDIKNFWMRADLRVRPEFRNNVCFGGNAPAVGNCNGGAPGPAGAAVGGDTTRNGKANDFYVQQWVRLGLGYDLSPDVNFYMEIIDSAVWGGNGNPQNAGNGGDPLIHNCAQSSVSAANANQGGGCRLGVRAAYVLVRNLAGVQGLSMKAGRQYVIFGNHSLFGHFDWANTGYSHDGIMFQYATKAFESHLGWFRNSETDLLQGSPVGSGAPNIVGTGPNRPDGSRDVDMFIFYNQVKNIPGILFEPYYVLYINNLHETENQAQGLGTAKASSQVRHMVGQRTELRKGGVDAILETAWQFGRMADGIGGVANGVAYDNERNLRINAWALRSWLGYTVYDWKMKPRLAINVDYASGDGDANCNLNVLNSGAGGTTSSSAVRCSGNSNTFENFFPTNHIHMGYADVIAWKNMFAPQVNFQLRPTERDHVEIWYMNMNLASARDNWYRAGQGPYIYSRNDNTKRHIGDEWDVTWTRMFADGKVAFQATYGHIFAGSYIAANTGQGQDQSWGFVQLWMNF